MIRASDPQLARIDVSVHGFLVREDLPPVELPFHRSPREVVVPREETASSCLSLEAKIDQFLLEKKGEAQEEPVEISNSDGKLDRSSIVRSPRLIVAWVDNSFDEEKEMALNRKKGLKELLAERNKGTSRS